MIKRCNKIIIGGGMANTFLKAKGFDVGNSLVEEDLIESHTNIESWNRDVSLQEARLQRRNEALEQALERNQQRQQTLGDRLDESVELTSVEEDFSYLEELMQEDDQVNEEEDE